MADNKINYDEIQEEYLDTIIRLAYKDAEDEEVQALLQEDDEAAATVPPEEKEAAFRLFLEKLEQEEKQASRQARVVQWKRVLPRIVNVAACIILILGIAAPFAVAHVDAIRVKVMELLIDIQDDHTELSFREDEDEEFEEGFDFGDEETTIYEVQCVCGEVINFDEETLEEGSIICPNCGETLEFDVEEDEE